MVNSLVSVIIIAGVLCIDHYLLKPHQSNNERRIYVDNLPPNIRKKDIDALFHKYGKILFIDLQTCHGPPFALVDFEDSRNAEDAVHSRNGYDYNGYKLRVEFPRGRERGPGGGFISDSRSGSTPVLDLPARCSQHSVIVSGLPPTASWQDLKDHMREAGDVCYADVYKDGTGVVKFLRHKDMKLAVIKLDDSRFRSHEGDVAYVKVRASHDGSGCKASSPG